MAASGWIGWAGRGRARRVDLLGGERVGLGRVGLVLRPGYLTGNGARVPAVQYGSAGRAASLSPCQAAGFSGIVRLAVLPELSRRPRSNDIHGPPMSLAARSQQQREANDAARTASLATYLYPARSSCWQ
jgi:hypothetical protein